MTSGSILVELSRQGGRCIVGNKLCFSLFPFLKIMSHMSWITGCNLERTIQFQIEVSIGSQPFFIKNEVTFSTRGGIGDTVGSGDMTPGGISAEVVRRYPKPISTGGYSLGGACEVPHRPIFCWQKPKNELSPSTKEGGHTFPYLRARHSLNIPHSPVPKTPK
jgi:hypothetical protein